MLLICSPRSAFPGSRLSWSRTLLAALAVVLSWTGLAQAQPLDARQYRAFWVDTFNTRLNSVADVTSVVTRARQAHANTLFVQVRRRGDAWYLNSDEPLPDGVAIDRDFDPLAEVIAQAHAANLEVHAFVVVGAIWNSTTAPTNPQHVFNRHGVNPSTGRPFEGRDNWLTRTLLPDGSATSVGGQRFGSDFWIDLGHPEAAAYTTDVLMRLVDSYDLDGLHLDRIRYPEINVSGQTPSTGASVGYNAVSLERYARRYGLATPVEPAPGDPQWTAWRREQVTAFVRRLYLEIAAARPRLKLSAATIAYGTAPASPGDWPVTEASWRVFQDWKAWLDEGILDIAVPMVYRTQHTASGRESFEQWVDFTAAIRGARHTVIGLGAYQNSLEGTLQQARRALGNGVHQGVAFFSMGASNAPVIANPLSNPADRDTALRSFDDVVAGLTIGKTANGTWLEAPSTFTAGLFALDVPVPTTPWKTSQDAGHIAGILRSGDSPVDGAAVVITGDAKTVETTSDGNGFYGAVYLPTGTYRVTVTPVGGGAVRSQCTVDVRGGEVAALDLNLSSGGVTASCSATASQRRRR